MTTSAFLERLVLNPSLSKAVSHHDDHSLSLYDIDDPSRVTLLYTFSYTDKAQLQYLQWLTDDLFLLIYRSDQQSNIYMYNTHNSVPTIVKHWQAILPFSIQKAQIDPVCGLQLLFAVRYKHRGVRLGIYIVDQENMFMITPLLSEPKLGFWNTSEQLIGINVQQKGYLYSYTMQQVDNNYVIVIGEPVPFPHEIWGKYKQLLITTRRQEQYYIVGWHDLEQQSWHWLYEYPFSEVMSWSVQGKSHVRFVGEGLYNGQWMYVIADSAYEHIQMFLAQGTLVQGIYQADIDWMMGIYQHVGHAPYACSVHLETNRYISWNNNDQGEQNAAYAYRKPIEYCSFVFSQQTLHYTDIVPVSPQPKHAVIYLHGGPHNCFMDSYSPVIEKLRDAGLRIIGFNYPGSSGFDYDYRQLIEQDWGGMDLDSLIHLRKTVLGDYTDVYLYGVSYGGYLALLAAGKASSLWTKVSACAPFTDLEHLHDTGTSKLQSFIQKEIGSYWDHSSLLLDRSPIHHIDHMDTVDIQIIHGTQDQLCPPAQSIAFHEKLYMRFKKHKRSFPELHLLNNIQHELYAERFWTDKVISFLTTPSL